MTAVAAYPAAQSSVAVGGQAVEAIHAGYGAARIANPLTAADQGISAAEPLFISVLGSAGLAVGNGTVMLAPGQMWVAPAGMSSAVSVNAATGGHRFSAVVLQPQTHYPPTLIPSSFPPAGPPGLTAVIRSYLYQQYTDDDDLQAFVDAYNALAQNVLQTMLDLNLPVYTQPVIAGALLDWVGVGLYGMPRPPLSSTKRITRGPLNTYPLNTIAIGALRFLSQNAVTLTTDDFYKRILTWHLWKGDGRVFTVRWLKRRIMRFLIGTNGTGPNIEQTYQVSVTFGTGNNVSIRLLHGLRTLRRGAVFNTFALNAMAPRTFATNYMPFAPLQYAEILKEAIDTGKIELPGGYVYTVTI